MKIYVKEGFVTDNSNECEAGCYFVKTATNAKFEAAAEAKGAKIINLAECKRLLGINGYERQNHDRSGYMRYAVKFRLRMRPVRHSRRFYKRRTHRRQGTNDERNFTHA